MATLYKRGKTWWIYTSANGQRRRWSLETTDARIAKQKLKKIEYEQSIGDLELPTTTPLPEFLQDYCAHLETVRTPKGLKNDISRLRTIFGPVCPALEYRTSTPARSQHRTQVKQRLAPQHLSGATLEELTPGMMGAHISARIRHGGIAPKTANRIRETLHVLFNYAISQHGFRSRDRRFPNPVDAVPRRRQADPEIRFLTLEDIDAQLRILSCRPAIQAMVACLIYGGFRREEILWLTHDDVDLETGMIRVRAKTIDGAGWRPKTRKNRRVPISSTLRPYLEACQAASRVIWFFTTPNGCRWNPDNFSSVLRTLNDRHDLKWSCLDYRHTFGSHLAMKGESLYKISELMGNSPEICRRHYAALVPEKMRDTVEFGHAASPIDGSDRQLYPRIAVR